MTELFKAKYEIETTPIRVTEKEGGGKHLDMEAFSCRVKDGYTRMPIGAVLHLYSAKDPGKPKYKAAYFFADSEDEFFLPAPGGSWGNRFDKAAYAVWKKYNEGLPRIERLKRFMWRWLGLGWLLVGSLLGGVASFVAQSLNNSS